MNKMVSTHYAQSSGYIIVNSHI